MKLNLRNIGALKEVVLEPKPLTIICGKNNTGKTYAMYSLWSLVELGFNVEFKQIELVSKEIEYKGSVDINLIDFFNTHLNDMVGDINSILVNTLPRTFNTERDFFYGSEMYLTTSKEEFIDHIRNDFDLKWIPTNRFSRYFIFSYDDGSSDLKISFNNRTLPSFMIKDLLNTLFARIIISQIGVSAFLMPTERAGLNLFFNELKTEKKVIHEYINARKHRDPSIIEKDSVEDFIGRSYYSLPIEEYINYITNEKIEYDDGNEDFVGFLNDNFSLMNSFKFKKDKGKIFFKDKDDNEFSLHLASSAIKTNLALWSYLSKSKYKHKLLMIDEPELNLHPDAQRLMARLIVYLVNTGTKVAVSTHSDYFIKEINSLIMLKNEFKDKKTIMERYGYKPFDALKSDDVIAYHFKEGFAEEMSIEQTSGIAADTFDDVSNDLNSAYNDIYFAVNSESIFD